MSKSSLTVDDRKWQQIKRQFPQLAGASVDVGIQSDAGADQEGTPIAAYAAYNEFGTSRIPARPFMRSTFDEQRRKWGNIADRALGSILSLTTAPEQALSILGEQAQSDIQRKITTLREPPNAQSTVDIKGSSNPLLDTGAMRQAIRYTVELGGN